MSGKDIERIIIQAPCFFLPLSGLGTVDNYKNYLDALDLTRVAWPQMDSTVRHVSLSGSTFTLDG